jgi:hypothetical protein
MFNFIKKLFKKEVKEWESINFYRLRKGQYVRVAVGFGSYLNEGVVSRVVVEDTDAYVWIDQINGRGECFHSFRESASYRKFEINWEKSKITQ